MRRRRQGNLAASDGRWDHQWRRRGASGHSPGARTAIAVLLGIAAWAGWSLAGPASTSLASSAAPPSGFVCLKPTHHDGDAIRCSGTGRSMRLYGIDAPEMPGSCRPGRRCTPGDPYAARDHLVSLTRGKPVECRQVDRDHYGRQIVRCTAGGVDLSCAMVRDGYAVERYGSLDCNGR